MTDFKTMLAEAKLPERTVPICLRGDLTAQFEDLERQLVEAQRRPAESLAGDGTAWIAEQMEELRTRMREHTYDFRLRALTRPAWRALLADHEPRRTDSGDVDDRDKYIGVNAETFFDALVRVSLVDPELDDADWRQLADERLTDKQFDTLSDAAWSLNRRDVDVPFSHAASRLLKTSEAE